MLILGLGPAIKSRSRILKRLAARQRPRVPAHVARTAKAARRPPLAPAAQPPVTGGAACRLLDGFLSSCRRLPRHPGNPMAAAPARGPSRAHAAAVRARPYPAPGIRRPRVSGPAVAALAPVCRARQHVAYAAADPAEPRPGRERVGPGSAQRIDASNAVGSRDATRIHICRCPAHPGRHPTRSGRPRHRHLRHRCRLPARCTERDGIGIGDSGRVHGARARGLDHWSSQPGVSPGVRDGPGSGANAPPRAPSGPFLTRPGLLGPCARANMEQTWRQNGHEKNDLESGNPRSVRVRRQGLEPRTRGLRVLRSRRAGPGWGPGGGRRPR